MFAYNKDRQKYTFMKSSIMLIFFMVLGCSMVGRIVPLEKRFDLVATGVKEALFKSGDLQVIYSYNIQGNLLEITGKTNKPQDTDSFALRLLFLNADGAVLQQSIVASVGYRVGRLGSNELNFSKTLELPTNTSGISFSYSGIPRTGRQ